MSASLIVGINLVFHLCIISVNRSEQLLNVTLSASLMHRQIGQKELICLAVAENVGLFLRLHRAVPQLRLSLLVAKNKGKDGYPNRRDAPKLMCTAEDS